MKRCKICHVEAELTDGRCHSCQMAKEATDHGMTYGKYVAMIEASKAKPKASKSRSVPGWKLCPSCGKKFYATHGNAKYCSALCSADAHYKMHREQIEKRKKPIEPKICAVCGKEFTPCRNDKRIKYCSEECREMPKWLRLIGVEKERMAENDRSRVD